MSTSHNGSKYALIEFGELSQVQQTVANLDRTRKFPFSGVQRNFPQRIVLFDAIIIDAELSQVRNPFVQKISIKKARIDYGSR